MTFLLPEPSPEPLEHAWAEIEALAASQSASDLTALLATEPQRFAQLRFKAAGLVIDASRQRLALGMLRALHNLADAARIADWRDAMIAGRSVNTGEDRPALHTALRDPDCMLHRSIDPSIARTVRDTLARMTQITRAVQSGRWRGATGRVISDIVHVGIGGSQLGPELACDALAAFAHPRLHCRFLGNVDPHAQHRALDGLNPLTTLVVIASKSWRTVETARNAQAIRQWLIEGGVGRSDLGKHLIAVSSNLEAATELGVLPSHILPCPDWVGGRFSLWGAVGLPVMLMVGPEHFNALLRGAHALDRHFCEAPPPDNAPLMMALLSVWNAILIGSGTEAVIPYSDALRRFAAHLQQLQMESCGKSVTRQGHKLARASMPVVWANLALKASIHFFRHSIRAWPRIQRMSSSLAMVPIPTRGRGAWRFGPTLSRKRRRSRSGIRTPTRSAATQAIVQAP